MVIGLALVLVVAVGVVAVVFGAARATFDDGTGRVVVAAGGVFVMVVVLVGAATGLGVDGGGDPSEGEPAPRVRTAVGDRVPLRPPAIELRATGADRLPPVPAAVGDLEDGAVVVVGVSGLGSGSRATVHQCRAGSVRASECRPGVPMVVSEHERAVVLVDLQRRFEAGTGERVDCEAVECSIVVFGTSRLEAVTAFGRAAPPPVTVEVEPSELAPGATLTATARHLPPGARTSFAVCRPGEGGLVDCGPPTPGVIADDAGMAAVSVTVAPGRCRRGSTCAVAVTVEEGGPRAYAPLRLIGRAGASYDDRRLGTGLIAAGLLLLVALVLLRRTDWTPVDGDPFAGVQIPEDPFAEAVPDG